MMTYWVRDEKRSIKSACPFASFPHRGMIQAWLGNCQDSIPIIDRAAASTMALRRFWLPVPRNLWTVWITLALLASLTCGTVHAATTPTAFNCHQLYTLIIPGDEDIYGETADVSGSPGDWQKSAATFRTDALAYRKCPRNDERTYGAAYLALWQSLLQHHNENPAWEDTLNTSTQLFETCVTRFYGSNRGGECATRVHANIKRQMAWESESS